MKIRIADHQRRIAGIVLRFLDHFGEDFCPFLRRKGTEGKEMIRTVAGIQKFPAAFQRHDVVGGLLFVVMVLVALLMNGQRMADQLFSLYRGKHALVFEGAHTDGRRDLLKTDVIGDGIGCTVQLVIEERHAQTGKIAVALSVLQKRKELHAVGMQDVCVEAEQVGRVGVGKLVRHIFVRQHKKHLMESAGVFKPVTDQQQIAADGEV